VNTVSSSVRPITGPGELAPPALARRMRDALDSYHRSAGVAPAETAESYLAAGERLLTDLLSGDCTSRDCALDLLTADALVTYAFELAASEPSRVSARAEQATARLAALASTP
jgi:hypothetical protein